MAGLKIQLVSNYDFSTSKQVKNSIMWLLKVSLNSYEKISKFPAICKRKSLYSIHLAGNVMDSRSDSRSVTNLTDFIHIATYLEPSQYS